MKVGWNHAIGLGDTVLVELMDALTSIGVSALDMKPAYQGLIGMSRCNTLTYHLDTDQHDRALEDVNTRKIGSPFYGELSGNQRDALQKAGVL